MTGKISHNQLGYKPNSPKPIKLVFPAGETAPLPDKIPFYLRRLFEPIPRDHEPPAAWGGGNFRWPFDLEKGKLRPSAANFLFQGELRKVESRWGVIWEGDFSAFPETGNFQIETDFGSTFPITIKEELYERISYGFLHYLRCQRSGADIPGIRRATHLDDAVLDTTGEYVPTAGGWYDAGDHRKWMFLTQPNLQALAGIVDRGHPGFQAQARAEIRWGNRFYHGMINPEGRVYEDVAGGAFRGASYESEWWFENHPGCNVGGDDHVTDNLPGTGDERRIRTTYNPAVHFMFARTQARVSQVLEGEERAVCLALAERAWRYGIRTGHDERTLFLAEQAWAAVELRQAGSRIVSHQQLVESFQKLLARQYTAAEGLSGYFMEANDSDGFRCIAAPCEPAFALLRMLQTEPAGAEAMRDEVESALRAYIDDYLLQDAESNPYGIPPYGVFVEPPFPDQQVFREAGGGRGVRTFIHPFNSQSIAHGTGGVIMHQANLLAQAAAQFREQRWKRAGENLLHWLLGHNPECRCLHTGVGYEHPTPFSAFVTQIPDAVCVGHIGRPDDSPYLETSPLIEWSTQEIWDVLHGYLAEASLWV